jgi:hypothetical protein
MFRIWSSHAVHVTTCAMAAHPGTADHNKHLQQTSDTRAIWPK